MIIIVKHKPTILKHLLTFFQLLFFVFAIKAQIPEPVVAFNFNNKSSVDDKSGLKANLNGVYFTNDRFGNTQNALYFNGNEFSYVDLGSSSKLKPRIGTIALWVKLELVVHSGVGMRVNPIILTKNSKNDDFFEAYCAYYGIDNERLQIAMSRDSTRQVGLFALGEFKRKKWHHLALTFDDDSVTFYLDGVKETQLPKKFRSQYLEGDPVYLGHSGNEKNNRFFNGCIDDVYFYHHVLSEDEITKLYNAPNPNRFKVLLYWIYLALGVILLVAIIYLVIKRRLTVTLKKEKEKLELQNIVLETELRVNRALMNPHFVFNSLNALQNFILKNENDQANNYLVKFSKLMRRILESNMAERITLEFEIELLERYLEIEDLRFDENIKHSISVAPDLKPSSIRIPIMMLQPFVENAIWHGLLNKTGDKQLSIRFELLKEKYILCTIEDNGTGRKKESQDKIEKQSLAINFIRQRLNLLNQIHNLECKLEIEDKPNSGGTIVRIMLPVLNN